MESSTTGVKLEGIRKKIEEYEEKGYDASYEEDWKKMLNDLNDIKISVYKDKIFSDNEELKDVKTEDIKFMLVAFYQSETIQKFQTNRKNILQFALKFYHEFFNLLKSYEVLSKDQVKGYEYLTKPKSDEEKNAKQNFEQMSYEREQKIAMYKYKKNLSEKIKQIEKEKSYDDNREFWISYLNLAIVKMFENIRMINMEIDSLNYIEKMKKEKEEKDKAEGKEIKEAKPEDIHKPTGKMEILKISSPEDLLKLDPNNKLVKNLNFITPGSNGFQVTTLDDQIVAQLPQNMRKEVFKNSNPTQMTMEEFAEIQMKRMEEAHEKQVEHEKNKSDSDSDHEEVSDKKTYKARAWDDWKDDHPKGSGNRMGK